MAIKNQNDWMDVCPEGWKIEQRSADQSCVVFHAPDKRGMVSVDFKQRVFRGGYSFHGLPLSTKKYAGRGWKQALAADAVEWLHGVLEIYK